MLKKIDLKEILNQLKMGNYLAKTSEARKRRPLLDIYVKARGFDIEYIYKYDNIVEPHQGKLDSYDNEVRAITKALDYMPILGIDFDEIVIHATPYSISYISNALYNKSEELLTSHFSNKNIRMVDIATK